MDFKSNIVWKSTLLFSVIASYDFKKSTLSKDIENNFLNFFKSLNNSPAKRENKFKYGHLQLRELGGQYRGNLQYVFEAFAAIHWNSTDLILL